MENKDNSTPEIIGPERRKAETDTDKLAEELNKLPFFMTNIPEDEENDALAALQALAYDGTPEEVAENFKHQGNDSFKRGKHGYKDAIAYYTKAIDTDCNDKKLMEACYANRAAVNLELGNYGKVLADCAKCLKLNPTNVKALYRSARGLFQLDRNDEAYACCEHALKEDPENAPVKQLQTKIKQKIDYIEKKKREKEEKELKEKKEKEQLNNALTSRKVKMVTKDKSVRETANIQYDEETNSLSWPVFFLYPEHKESDYIQQFNEYSTFQDQLDVILEQPAPWDQKDFIYNPKNVQVYFENTQGLNPTLIKIGNKLPLGKILSLDQYVVTDGIPSFIILPKTGTFKDEFLEKYKKKPANESK